MTDIQRSEGRALDLVGLPDRCVRYIFSDASVGRDMHTIAPDAWQTGNFARNPVFLWAHQSDEPPIGRVEDLRTEAGRLVGQVRYAERDAYPFADTIYELTKRGFLNATSTGWIPLEWTAAKDRARPGGLDFRKVELLEISQVPVPALPTALVTARSAGVDTRPLFDWAERMLDLGGFASIPRTELEELRKAARMPSVRRNAGDVKCGAARDLAIDHTAKWDGPEAAERMLDAATEGGKINVARARRGFLLYDAGNAQERGAYKEPFADIIDGKLTAVASGIRAAASRLPQVEGASAAAKDSARAVIDHYAGQMTKEGGHAKADAGDGGERSFAALARAALRRDLMNVAELCWHMDNLEGCYGRCMREAEIEGDGSEIPGRMRAWLDDGHRILRDMAGEETQEQIDGTQADPYRAVGVVEAAVARALKSLGVVRIGKSISAANRAKIRAAHGHAKAAVESLSDLIDDDDNANPDDGTGDDVDPDDLDSRALRERKARARALKVSAQAQSS